ncbi:hypothetical protein [Pontibacter liquoris]|uniref:hypothetical protein n=1 Tax=Pontibacter liquoris TaxID=2905677 RepID=UPI001FA75542|nr:hypothetical protein [Pontibacter liquoris]
MRLLRLSSFFILSIFLLAGTGCQRKGIIPCPKQNGKNVMVKSKGAGSLEAISVPTDKNGRVKKHRKLLGLF